jgi:hypothetical protein
MPTPEQLRRISQDSLIQKSIADKAKTKEVLAAKAKAEAEKTAKAQFQAQQAIAWAEENMEKVAREGLSAALVYRIGEDEIVEAELRSLGTGSIVDSPDKFFYGGAARIIYAHFQEKGFNVMIHSEYGFPETAESNPKKYYIKVGW